MSDFSNFLEKTIESMEPKVTVEMTRKVRTDKEKITCQHCKQKIEGSYYTKFTLKMYVPDAKENSQSEDNVCLDCGCIRMKEIGDHLYSAREFKDGAKEESDTVNVFEDE